MDVAITGIGLVTPLGCNPREILERIDRGESAFQPLADPCGVSPCPSYAPITAFDPTAYFPENKTLRMMSRDAQLAVVAARRAITDANISPGELYRPEEIALYGATGLSGIAPREISRLVRGAAADDGTLDLERFGSVALRRTRPVLSFKILSNMPICFVSIFENICGPNAVFTPWEGNAAQAISAGVRAIRSGSVPCALVGGCDVKTHTLSIAGLQRLGVLDSWGRTGCGTVPGEGATFLVLEGFDRAVDRGARIYARFKDGVRRSISEGELPAEAIHEIFEELQIGSDLPNAIVAAGDDEPRFASAESEAIKQVGISGVKRIEPKRYLGNLFAAAAALNVALAAELVRKSPSGSTAVANCFGWGGEPAAFMLEAL